MQISPTLEIEPLLVDYVVKLFELGMPLNRNGVIELAMSMIDGHQIEEKIRVWKKKHIFYSDNKAMLGKAGTTSTSSCIAIRID